MHTSRSDAHSPLPPLPESIPPAPDPSAPNGYGDAPEGLTDGTVGPLTPIPFPFPIRVLRSLRAGCWLINYQPHRQPNDQL